MAREVPSLLWAGFSIVGRLRVITVNALCSTEAVCIPSTDHVVRPFITFAQPLEARGEETRAWRPKLPRRRISQASGGQFGSHLRAVMKSDSRQWWFQRPKVLRCCSPRRSAASATRCGNLAQNRWSPRTLRHGAHAPTGATMDKFFACGNLFLAINYYYLSLFVRNRISNNFCQFEKIFCAAFTVAWACPKSTTKDSPVAVFKSSFVIFLVTTFSTILSAMP